MAIRDSVREIFLIVVAVLLAFAIESRWNDAQEAREDRGYLEALRAEIAVNREETEARKEKLAASLEAIEILTGRAVAAAPAPDEIPALLWSATDVNAQENATAALESLVNSASWARIEEPELQRLLSRLHRHVSVHSDFAEKTARFWFHSVEPYLRTRIDFVVWEESFGGSVDLGAEAESWLALTRDRELRNLLTHQRWFAHGLMRGAETSIRTMDEILAALPE